MQAPDLLYQVEQFKEELIDEVTRQAAWHARKAVENPVDPRLQIGADVLSAVAAQLVAIPCDHPRMREAWRKWYGLKGGSESANHQLFRAVILQEFYVNYGFKWESGSAENFLLHYVEALNAAEEVTPKQS